MMRNIIGVIWAPEARGDVFARKMECGHEELERAEQHHLPLWTGRQHDCQQCSYERRFDGEEDGAVIA